MIRSIAPRRTVTFVVRMWAEPATDVDNLWRGQVEHLQSGERQNFIELKRIEEFIADHLRMEENRPMVE